MSEVTITVRGEHEVRVLPELAVAHVTVAVDGPDRGGVVERVAALAFPIREDLTSRASTGTVADWSSQRVSVWADRPWNNEGRQLDLVHHASVDFTVTFTDFMVLSDWLGEVAGRDGIQVGTVEWQLAPDTRARIEREVATAAVSVAVERATAYASAIGLSEVTAVEIADLGLLTGAQESAPSARMFSKAAMAMDAGGASPIEFQPDDIVVGAAVEARFRAS